MLSILVVLIDAMIKTGHPYMEVQRIEKSETEMIPDWLLDAALRITSAAGSRIVEQPCTPIKNWHKSLEAEQVHYYCRKKYEWKNGNLPCIQSTDDSDSCTFSPLLHFSMQFIFCN
jgi:hypothetical protein